MFWIVTPEIYVGSPYWSADWDQVWLTEPYKIPFSFSLHALFWYSKVSPEAAASYLTYSQIKISHFVTSHLFLRLTLINVFYPIFLHFLQIQWKGKRKLPKAVDCQFAAPSCNNTRSLANLLPAARLFLIFVAQCNEWWRSLLKKVYLLVSLEVLMFISMGFFLRI